MTAYDIYGWSEIWTTDDCEQAYTLEKIFYKNKLPMQLRGDHAPYCIWVPNKYAELSAEIIGSAGSLDTT